MKRVAQRRTRHRGSPTAESLEPRRLLAAAELVAALPAASSQNATFYDPVSVGGRLFFTGQRHSEGERLYLVEGSPVPTELFAASGTNGITQPSPFGGRLYFYANGPEGDGLYTSDGTAAGTRPVKILRDRNNALPDVEMRYLGDRLYFYWIDWTAPEEPPQWWSTDGTTEGTVLLDRLPAGTRLLPGRTGLLPLGSAVASDSRQVGIHYGSAPDANNVIRGAHYLEPGRGIHSVRGLGVINGRVIVQADRNGVPEIWSLDPTILSGSVRGIMYSDFNRNGRRDGFEQNMGGVVLDLNGNGRADDDDLPPIRLAEGEYYYGGLVPGRYTLLFDPNRGVPGSTPTPDGGVRVIDVAPGQAITGADFTWYSTEDAVLWGTFFLDQDEDGVRDPDEGRPTHGVTVYLDLNGDGLRNQDEPIRQPSPDGTYGFVGITPGTYTLRRAYDPRSRQTTPAPPSAPIGTVTVGHGQVVEAPPVGVAVVEPGTITGAVWLDWNRNGTLDGDDTLFRWDVPRLYLDLNRDGRPNPEEPIWNSGGQYVLPNVAPGEVRLSTSTTGYPWLSFTGPRSRDVVVPAGGTLVMPEFLIFDTTARPDTARISGTLWFDADGDGARGAGEPPLAGRTVFIDTDRDGVLDVAERRDTTDVDGGYDFPNTAPGTYAVSQLLPNGWSQTYPTTPPRTVTVAAGQHATGIDFGSRVPPPAAAVVARHVFYNRSAFDGNDAAASAADDAAIATDKMALVSGSPGLASFVNVTSYHKGINGVMVDVANLPAGDTLSAADFMFEQSRGNPSAWSPSTPPHAVSVRRGAGVGGSDRVTLVWTDYSPAADSPTMAVANGWLRVTVSANERTGLAAPHTFSFGNLVGETGDVFSRLRVSVNDTLQTRRNFSAAAPVTSRYDFNRDGRVGVTDFAVARSNLGRTLAAPASAIGSATPPAPAAAPPDDEDDGVWQRVATRT